MATAASRHRRVLLVEEASDTGGAVMSLESMLPRDGMVGGYAFAVALGGEGRVGDRLRARGAAVHVMPVQGWRWFEPRRTAPKLVASMPLQAASIGRWIRFLRRERPALVHLNSNRLVEPLIASRLLRLPVIVHFRDIPSRMTPPFLPGAAGFYWLMNRADRWIANSSATAADIRPHARVPIATIPNGIDLEEFDRRAGEAGLVEQAPGPHVAMVALINPWKRYEHFIEVAANVARRRPDVRFSIAGDGRAEYVRELRALAAARGLERALTFTGHIDNIPGFLTSIDLLVHTTDPEPFGRVFLEAMAAKRPVVAFRSGGAAEIITDGMTGALIDPGDVGGMAEAVGTLLDDAPRRQRLGAAGRRRVEECYSAERYRARVASEYDAVLNAR